MYTGTKKNKKIKRCDMKRDEGGRASISFRYLSGLTPIERLRQLGTRNLRQPSFHSSLLSIPEIKVPHKNCVIPKPFSELGLFVPRISLFFIMLKMVVGQKKIRIFPCQKPSTQIIKSYSGSDLVDRCRCLDTNHLHNEFVSLQPCKHPEKRSPYHP